MAYYWLSWLGIVCLVFFFTNKQNLHRLFLWLLTLNIIFINSQIQFGIFTFTLPYLYSFIIFWLLIVVKTMPYFNYFLLFSLIFFYLGLRFILIASPIWLLMNPFSLITIPLVLVLTILIKNKQERIYLLVSSCITGEWLYAYNAKSLDWEIIIGEAEFFMSIYFAIFLIYLFQQLTLGFQFRQIR